MFNILKKLFGFTSGGRVPMPKIAPPPPPRNTGVAKPNNPPCPPVLESQAFKKAKEILNLEAINWSYYRQKIQIGDVELLYCDGYDEDSSVEVTYKGLSVDLRNYEKENLACIWAAKESIGVRKEKERINSDFIKLNLNEITGNKTTD